MQVYCLLHSGDWWYTFVPQKDAASDVGSNSGYLVEYFPSQFWKCNLLLKRSLKIKSSDNSNTVHTWYLTFSFLKNTTLLSPGKIRHRQCYLLKIFNSITFLIICNIKISRAVSRNLPDTGVCLTRLCWTICFRTEWWSIKENLVTCSPNNLIRWTMPLVPDWQV